METNKIFAAHKMKRACQRAVSYFWSYNKKVPTLQAVVAEIAPAKQVPIQHVATMEIETIKMETLHVYLSEQHARNLAEWILELMNPESFMSRTPQLRDACIVDVIDYAISHKHNLLRYSFLNRKVQDLILWMACTLGGFLTDATTPFEGKFLELFGVSLCDVFNRKVDLQPNLSSSACVKSADEYIKQSKWYLHTVNELPYRWQREVFSLQLFSFQVENTQYLRPHPRLLQTIKNKIYSLESEDDMLMPAYISILLNEGGSC